MKKRSVWLSGICIIIATLLLLSCAPAVPEEKPVTPTDKKPTPTKQEPAPTEEGKEIGKKVDMVKLTLTKNDGTVVEKLVEKPRYGGVFVQGLAREYGMFDEAFGSQGSAPSLHLTNEELLMGDWYRGPTGTDEASFLYNMMPSPGIVTGSLAESWEMSDDATFVFHIRKGVRWHNKPPMNGRELVADDVVFSIDRLWHTPTAYHGRGYPWDQYFESITAPDKWTVVVKCKPGRLGPLYEMVSNFSYISPPEVIEEYGDMGDWRNSCGTGPYMLVDFVTGSSMTFERNPNYWGKDPLHPENQLPYLDGVKWLFIPDISTRMSAMRTAKIDWLGGMIQPIEEEDGQSLIKTSPELKYKRYFGGNVGALYYRVDKPELPIYDIRVRRALAMAVDNQEIVDSYYGGNAEILNWPVPPLPEFSDIYIPLDEHAESIRELYEYHPDKARQLLAEAGYPDGFKTQIVCKQSDVDILSIIKDYWSRIGIDLELHVKEPAVLTTVGHEGAYDIFMGNLGSSVMCLRVLRFTPGSAINYGKVDDPVINEARDVVNAAYFDEPNKRKLYTEFFPYMMEQNYILPLPGSYAYLFWQPWVKGYNGEIQPGGKYKNYDFPKYIWYDQNLKEEMTGRR